MATIYEKLTAVGDAIRAKTGKTAKLSLDEMASDLNAIANRTSSNLTASGATVSVPAGNYKAAASKSVATATQATPSISVSSAGLITASATQTAGYVSAGTKSATKQLTAQAEQTITPGTTNKTIASGRYLTGTQTIKGDANLVAANIVQGKSIFGVSGSYAGTVLNYTVVGGTSTPSSPTNNMIWVNTSTTITSHVFSATQPSSPSAGMVWIKTGTGSNVAFTTTTTNPVYVYPLDVKQYVSGSWVSKTAKSYQNNAWVSWIMYYFNYGAQSYAWEAKATNFSYATYTGTNTAENQSDGSVIFTAATNNYVANSGGIYTTTSDIDLSDIKTLTATFEVYRTGDAPRVMAFVVYPSSATDPYTGAAAKVSVDVPASGSWVSHTKTLDVSSLTGSYKIGFGVGAASRDYTATTTKYKVKTVSGSR